MIACMRVRLCLASAATGLPGTPVTTYMVKGGSGIGGFGGGWLEHLRPWLCTKWPGLSPWVSQAARSHQARPEETHEAELIVAKAAL